MKQEGFEFCNFRFYPNDSLLVRLRDNHQFKLTHQQSQFFTLLISKSGHLVSYSEIRKELWPEAGTTLVALKLASRFTLRATTAIAQATLILILAAALLFIALGLVLPQQPVTQATFQTYSAHAAYLKNIFYFLPLGILFVVVPFRLVLGQRRHESDSRLRVWHLVVLLGIAALVSFWLTSNLLNNVLPGPHLDLFIKLVEGRRILYFGLGLECVIWYYLNTSKPERHETELVSNSA